MAVAELAVEVEVLARVSLADAFREEFEASMRELGACGPVTPPTQDEMRRTLFLSPYRRDSLTERK